MWQISPRDSSNFQAVRLSGPPHGLLRWLKQREAFNCRGGLQQITAWTKELDFVFFDEPDHQMPIALKLATTKQAVANQQRFMQFNRLLRAELMQLSGNSGSHSFDRTGRAHCLTITLLAKAKRIAGELPHNYRTFARPRGKSQIGLQQHFFSARFIRYISAFSILRHNMPSLPKLLDKEIPQRIALLNAGKRMACERAGAAVQS